MPKQKKGRVDPSKMRDTQRKRNQRRKDKKGGYLELPDGVEFFKVQKEGIYRFDILPFELKRPDPNDEFDVGDWAWVRNIHVHFNVGPNQRTMLCPGTVKQPCPVCEEIGKMRRNPEIDDSEIKPLRAKHRQLFWIIDVTNRDKGPQIFEMAYYNFGEGLDARLQEADDDEEECGHYYDFPLLDQGLTVKAAFQQQSFEANKFYRCTKPDLVARKKQYDESILDEVTSFCDMLRIPKAAEMEREFYGGGVAEEDDEEQEDDSVPARRIPRSVPDDDEEDEQEPEENEAEEEEETTAPFDDDDDEEQEEEAAEEPAFPVDSAVVYTDSRGKKYSAHVLDFDDGFPRRYRILTADKKSLKVWEDRLSHPEPKEKPATKPKKKELKSGDKCPYGHVFGADAGDYDDCDECEYFDACSEAG